MNEDVDWWKTVKLTYSHRALEETWPTRKSGQTQPGPNTVEHELHAGFDNEVNPHSDNTDFFVWSFPAPFGSTAMLKFSSSLPVVRESHVNLLQLFVSEEKLGAESRNNNNNNSNNRQKKKHRQNSAEVYRLCKNTLGERKKKKKSGSKREWIEKPFGSHVYVTVFSGL